MLTTEMPLRWNFGIIPKDWEVVLIIFINHMMHLNMVFANDCSTDSLRGKIRVQYSRPRYGGFLGYHDTVETCFDEGANRWYHIAATKNENTANSGGIKIYKNGVRLHQSFVYPNLDSDLNTIENVNTPIILGIDDSSNRPNRRQSPYGFVSHKKRR